MLCVSGASSILRLAVTSLSDTKRCHLSIDLIVWHKTLSLVKRPDCLAQNADTCQKARLSDRKHCPLSQDLTVWHKTLPLVKKPDCLTQNTVTCEKDLIVWHKTLSLVTRHECLTQNAVICQKIWLSDTKRCHLSKNPDCLTQNVLTCPKTPLISWQALIHFAPKRSPANRARFVATACSATQWRTRLLKAMLWAIHAHRKYILWKRQSKPPVTMPHHGQCV